MRMEEVPLKLTVRFQVWPDHTKYTMFFETKSWLKEGKRGRFKEFTGVWIDEFVMFIKAWSPHSPRSSDTQ